MIEHSLGHALTRKPASLPMIPLDQRLLDRLGDQTGSAVERDVQPCPLDHDQETVVKPDQEEDVDE